MININGTDYKFKRTMRSIMLFEQKQKKNITDIGSNVSDILNYYYCVLQACNRGVKIPTFDEFLDYIDETEGAFQLMGELLAEEHTEKKAQPEA
jgi:hypothetical protein